MTRLISLISICSVLLLFSGTTGFCTTFDERHWENYADIQTSPGARGSGLAGAYLDPHQFDGISGKTPFADFRVVTDKKEEVAWQIVARKPERRQKEIPHRMQNLSLTEKGETWLELLIDKQDAASNAI